jgi:hypothetical protein
VGTRSRIEGLNVVVRRAKSRSSLKVTAKLTRLAASYSTEEALFLTNISSTRPGAEDRTRVCCCRRGLESSVIAHCFDLHPKMHPNCNFRKYPQDRFDSRGLPHDKRGEVEQAAWQALYTACQSGHPR